MNASAPVIILLEYLDSNQMAAICRQELDIQRYDAQLLGLSAVEAAKNGFYTNSSGRRVDFGHFVTAACSEKQSIPPQAVLPPGDLKTFPETYVQVSNETTLQAGKRLVSLGKRPLALNFANGIHPGGGFLNGARAQEEALCRSSALYQTILNDPMYVEHGKRQQPDSTDWAIFSPKIPVFRTDKGIPLDEPWLLDILTCAAPYAPTVGRETSRRLLSLRIYRVLAIAHSLGFSEIILGAWGCGAFANDPLKTAEDFKRALETEYLGAFSEVVFAISDWSPERRYIGPFHSVFYSYSGN
jgi:uncharacterized protein (TIGR02452 family)